VIAALGSLARRLDGWIDAALHWDRRAVHAIAEHPALQRWARMFVTATYLGDGYLWAGLAAGLLLFGRPVDRWYVVIGAAVTAANMTIAHFIKLAAGRLRPRNLVTKLRLRLVDGYSFPSGHATTSFGVAWVVARSYPHPAVQVPVYVAAAMIAFSRVCVREHYPLDVAAGAILGSGVAVLLYPVIARLVL